MKDVVAKYVNWIEENSSVLEFNLNGPADITAINDCQSKTGEKFPSLLRDLYLRFDGQAWEARNGIIYDLHLVTLEEVQEMADLETLPSKEELVMDGVWKNDLVKPYIYYPRWIPFAKDCSGEFLSLDQDPGINGVKGQVIRHGEFDAVVVANSFEEFLQWYVNQLETGKYYIGSPLEGIYEEPTTVFGLEDGRHIFDNAL